MNGTLAVDIGGTTPGTGHDAITVTGIADLSGGMVVSLINGFEPKVGDMFRIVDAGTVTDAFDVVIMPALDAGRFMRVVYDAGVGSGGVTLVVETLATLFTFDGPRPFMVPGVPTDVTAADFDLNGFLDLAITIPGDGVDGTVLVLINAGGHEEWLGFGSSVSFGVGRTPTAIKAGLLDPGGRADLSVTNGDDNDVSVLLTSATFPVDPFVRADFATGGVGPSDLALADFDQSSDGNATDMVVTHAGSDDITFLRNDGSGVFTVESQTQAPPGANSGRVDPADLDNDKEGPGSPAIDLVVTFPGLDQVGIFHGVGDGTFTFDPMTDVIDVGPSPADQVLGLFDEDGFVDVITANLGDGGAGSGTLSVVINTGDGTGSFTPSVEFPVGDASSSLTAFDVDLDGDLDLAVVTEDAGSRLVRLVRNDTDGQGAVFAPETMDLAVGDHPVLVTAVPLDADGRDDLVIIAPDPEPSGGIVCVRLDRTPGACPWDLDGNGFVDFGDILRVLSAWGSAGGPEDLDGSGIVGFGDLLEVLAHWGPCP